MIMRKVILFIFTILLCSAINGQDKVVELFQSKDYLSLTTYVDKENSLNSEELYMVGYAFFQLEKDDMAISFYDKAIAKGFDNGNTHFYKCVSLTYLQKYDEAIKEINLALQKEPNNQEYMNQKGLVYKSKGQEDKALDYFEEATRYPNTYGEPFFWVAYIYHGKKDFEKALKCYYIAAQKVPKHNNYYGTTLQSIGQLEYTYTQNFQKSAIAYAEAVALRPKDYKWYSKLIKAYNANKEYSKADKVFELLKAAYNNNELSGIELKDKMVGIDEFEWKKQRLNVYKSIEDPKKVLDISFKVYLLNKSCENIERVFTVEKTIQTQGGTKHLLCEEKKEVHLTYPYGWKTDTIALEDLKKAIVLILKDELKPTASSKF
jgi:tetratricopeptide (TPR) repeat protein